VLGAASSSCSYAAAATTKTLFKKGAALVPALAFLLASTNLVIEIGIVIWMFLGWRFVLAEVAGALVMIGIIWLLARLFISETLVRQAREHTRQEAGGGHEHTHGSDQTNGSLLARMKQADNWAGVARAFSMDISMLWKEIVIGVLIAGLLATLVPQSWWEGVFLTPGGPNLRLLENAVVGPLIALASFVCSVGNIPFAGLLWSSGISFGGVIAFIYGDLIVIPLILAYRKYYGRKMAWRMTGLLFVAMVMAGIIVEWLFGLCGWLPEGPRSEPAIREAAFQWNYTTWLNLPALAMASLFIYQSRSASQE